MVNIRDFKTWFHLPTSTSSLAARSGDVISSPRGKHCHPVNECLTSDETTDKERQIAAKSQLTTIILPKIYPNTSEPSDTAGANERKESLAACNPPDQDYFKNSLKSTKSSEDGKIINQSPPIFNVCPTVPADIPSSPIGSETSTVNSETLFLPLAATSSLVSASGEKEEVSIAPQNIDHLKSWLKSTKNIEKEEEEISSVMTVSSDIADNALSLTAEGSKNEEHPIVFETASSDIGAEKSSHLLTKPMRKLFKKKIWWTRERRNTGKRASSESSYYHDDPSFPCDSKMQNANHHRHSGKKEYVTPALKEAVGRKGHFSSLDIDRKIDSANRNHKIRKWKNRDSQVSSLHHIVGICEPRELNQPINEMESDDSLHSFIIPPRESGSEILFHKRPSLIIDLPNNKNKMSSMKESHKQLKTIISFHTSLRTKKVFNNSDGAIGFPRFSPIRSVQEEFRELNRELLWSGEFMHKNENKNTSISFQKNVLLQDTLSTDKRKINPSTYQQPKGDYSGLSDQETSQKFSSQKLKETSYPLSFRYNVYNRELYESHQNDYDSSSIAPIINDEARHLQYYHRNKVFDIPAAPNLSASFPYIFGDFQSSELPRVETNAFVFNMDIQRILDKPLSSGKASTLQSYHHDGIRKLHGILSSSVVSNFSTEQNIRTIAEPKNSDESISSKSDIEDYEIILPKRRSSNDNILRYVPNGEESFQEGSSSCYDLSEDRLITTDYDMEETQLSFETVIHHPLRSISIGPIPLCHEDNFDISALKLSSDEERKNREQTPSSNLDVDLLPQKKDLGSLFDVADIEYQENVALSNTGRHIIISTLLAADGITNVHASVSSETQNTENVVTIHHSLVDPHISLSESVDDRSENDPVNIKYQEIPKVRTKIMQAYTASTERPKFIPTCRVNSFSSIDFFKTLHALRKSFNWEIRELGAYEDNRGVNHKLRFNGALNGVSEKKSSSQRTPSFVDDLFGMKQHESEVPNKRDETHLLPSVECPIILVEEELNTEKSFVVSQDLVDAPCLVHWPVEEENWFAKILGEYCPSRFRNNERFNYDNYGFKVKQYYMTTRALLQDRYKTCGKVVFAPRPDKWFNFEMEKDYLDEIDDFIKLNKNLYPLFKGPRIVRRKHVIRRWMNRKRDRQIIMEQLMEYWRRDPHIIDSLKWERQTVKPFPAGGLPVSHTNGYKPCQRPERPSLKLVASRIFQRMTMDLAHKRLGRPPREGSSVIMLRKGPPLGIDYFGYKRDRIKEWAHDLLLNL